MSVLYQNIGIDQNSKKLCMICMIIHCDQGSRATSHREGLHTSLNKKTIHIAKSRKRAKRSYSDYSDFLLAVLVGFFM